MADTGLKSASSITGIGYTGHIENVDATHLAADDNSYAIFHADGCDTQYQGYFLCSNFAANIPANATIIGIELQIKAKSTQIEEYPWRLDEVYIYINGSGYVTNKPIYQFISTTEQLFIVGGQNDKWNQASNYWTPTMINNANFGFFIYFEAPSVQDSSNDEILYVDMVALKVYYALSDTNKQSAFFQLL